MVRQLVCLLFLFSVPGFALKTAYLTFDHPEAWKCELAEGVWICQSTTEADRRESVVLSIAALATEWDNLDNYLEYLKTPKTIRDEEGKEITSQVTYARKRNINGYEWADALHHQSELAGFWTRYLATVMSNGQAKLAVLVTYVVSDARYDSLAPVFERMTASLKPNTEFNLNVPSTQGEFPPPGAQRLGSSTRELIADRLNLKKKAVVPESEPDDTSWIWLVVGGVAVVFLLFRILSRKKVRKIPREPTS